VKSSPRPQIKSKVIIRLSYYVDMRITLSFDREVLKKARKVAADRSTTLTELVRQYLKTLVAENAEPGRKQRELEALERTFSRFKFKIGKRTWTRADLHERP
jgi:hypothetical protein